MTYTDDPLLRITIWITAIATAALLSVLEIAPKVGGPPASTPPSPWTLPIGKADNPAGSVERDNATRYDQTRTTRRALP